MFFFNFPAAFVNRTTPSNFSFLPSIETAKFYIEGIGILCIGLLGLVINLFALYILFRKQVSVCVHVCVKISRKTSALIIVLGSDRQERKSNIFSPAEGSTLY